MITIKKDNKIVENADLYRTTRTLDITDSLFACTPHNKRPTFNQYRIFTT